MGLPRELLAHSLLTFSLSSISLPITLYPSRLFPSSPSLSLVVCPSLSSSPRSLSHLCSLSLSLQIPIFFSPRQAMTTAQSGLQKDRRRARARGDGSKGAKPAGGSSVGCEMPPLTVMASRGRALVGWCLTLSLPFLGSNKFISISSSKWYPSFLMKVPRLLAHISVQKRKLCKWI